MSEENKICPCCGAKIVEYRFSLNKGLKGALIKLFNAHGESEIARLGLTKSQYTNIAKLRYWGLIRGVDTKTEPNKRGHWEITDKGKAFVVGLIDVPKYVVTKQGEVIRYEGDCIYFSEIDGDYEVYGDYVDQIREVLRTRFGQTELF